MIRFIILKVANNLLSNKTFRKYQTIIVNKSRLALSREKFLFSTLQLKRLMTNLRIFLFKLQIQHNFQMKPTWFFKTTNEFKNNIVILVNHKHIIQMRVHEYL